jgi:hypothetical protein
VPQSDSRRDDPDPFTRSEKLDITLMQREVRWYQSAPAACGETIRLSVMYGVHIPCSHQYSLRLEKPSVPHQYNLSFTDSWSKYVLDIVTIEREVLDALPIYIADVKGFEMRNIKRFSQLKRKDDRKAYMDKSFTMGYRLPLGLPIAIFGLISEGIAHFRK